MSLNEDLRVVGTIEAVFDTGVDARLVEVPIIGTIGKHDKHFAIVRCSDWCKACGIFKEPVPGGVRAIDIELGTRATAWYPTTLVGWTLSRALDAYNPNKPEEVAARARLPKVRGTVLPVEARR